MRSSGPLAGVIVFSGGVSARGRLTRRSDVRFWPHGVMRPQAAMGAAAEPTAGSGYTLAC